MATYFANVTLFDGRALKTRAGVLVANGTISWVGAHTRNPGRPGRRTRWTAPVRP